MEIIASRLWLISLQTMTGYLWLMSLQACLVILLVLVARVLLKKYPKVLSYSLWSLVALRLLCPVFVESPFSLQPDYEAVAQRVLVTDAWNKTEENVDAGTETSVQLESAGREYEEVTSGAERVPLLQEERKQPEHSELTEAGLKKASEEKLPEKEVRLPEQKPRNVRGVLMAAYLSGAVLFAVVYVVRYLIVMQNIKTAVRQEGNVWFCDRIKSPFVIGLVHPKIILPFGLTGQEMHYIVLHEETHLRHYDPLIRFIGVVCLCLHWWNPFVWVAVHFMNKDMEMFCDEAALKEAEQAERKAYAETLLAFAARQSGFSVGLAFGESNAEQRIKNIVKNKKRSRIIFWSVVAAALVCIVAFLTIPKQEAGGELLPEEVMVTPVPSLTEEPEQTVAPEQNPIPTAVMQKKQAHVFTKTEVLMTNPVPDYFTLDTLMDIGTVRSIKGILPGAAPGTWYVAENRGVVYYWGCLDGESAEQAKLYSYAVFSEEYPLANGIKVGMSKVEILNLYPDMAVVGLQGESYEESPAWNLGFDSSCYPHSLSGEDETINYQGKQYWYWQDQFDYCLLAEIDGETHQGRAMALALMMRNDKVEAITYYCTNDGTVTPEEWTIEVSVPWELEQYSNWKPSSVLLEQVPEPGSYEEKAREAYTKALYELYQEHTLPDGTYVGDDMSEDEEGSVMYAICDIDKDGRDELCVEYLRYTGNATTLIYEYRQETDNFWEEAVFPSFLSFFDNGIAVVQLSHNHSYAVREGRELWPYHLYWYHPVSDTYELFAEVEGWDKFYMQSSVAVFPEKADRDGDGMVYFVNDMPLDKEAYENWFAGAFEGTGRVMIEYQLLTEETIGVLLK